MRAPSNRRNTYSKCSIPEEQKAVEIRERVQVEYKNLKEGITENR